MDWRCILLLLAGSCILLNVTAQDSTATAIRVSEQFTRGVNRKISGMDDRLTQQSEKYLRSLSKQEATIRRKLAKLDSSRAAEIFSDTQQAYEQLSRKLSSVNGKMDKAFSGQYLPGLDSLQGALGFLKEAKHIVSRSKDIQQKLGSSLEQAKQLQNKLQQADEIRQYVQQRQHQIEELLSNYTNLPKDITKHMGKYRQQAYYYGRQVQEYKDALNDPDKLVKKVLATLQTVPAFKKFMQKHSMLAQLFPMPENYGAPQALTGLQTRAGVQQLMQQRIGIPATNGATASPAQYLQQQIQQAQGELNKLKDRLNQLGNGGSSDMAIPDFKPNGQKTKSFLQRIELGTSFQTRRSDHYFPTTTDIALTAGYKLNDKSIVGIGIAGKLGWGKNWKHIRVTGEGIGLRAYADWKAPGLLKTNSRFMASLWFTAGAEMNYTRTVESLTVFKNYSNWTRSALAGLTKKYSISSPLKKGKKAQGTMQVLYDFLYKQHVPPTPALVWRVGWSL
jgi:hypothetical protein